MKRLSMMVIGFMLASNVLMAATEAFGRVADGGDRFGSNGIDDDGLAGQSGRGRYGPTYDDFGAPQPRYGIRDGRKPRCWFPEEWPKLPPWPPYCD
jgi:hypothetical protein